MCASANPPPGGSMPLEVECESVQRKRDTAAEFLLLDCRQRDEHARVHIDGAMLLPMDELPTRCRELEPFRQIPIIIYCHLGGRSLAVAEWLRQHGFPLAQSMAGGIDRWAAEIDPSLPRY